MTALTDWSKRQGALGHHKHFASDIIGDDAEPADLGGEEGSGVTVDNGSDPPAAVTTLVAPGAVIVGDTADLSQTLQVRLFGPFVITNADIGEPARDLVEIAEGSLVLSVFTYILAEFSGDAAIEIQFLAGGFGFSDISGWQALNGLSTPDPVPAPVGTYVGGLLDGFPALIINGDVTLTAEVRFDGGTETFTEGLAHVFAIIATPAS